MLKFIIQNLKKKNYFLKNFLLSKVIKLSFIFFFFLNFNLYANCNFDTSNYLDEMRDLNSIKKIFINVNDFKKWSSNNMRILSQTKIIDSELKRKFKSKIKVTYSFGECEYLAKIQQHGNEKDHIKFIDGNFVKSLKVELLEANIAGIVKFILFLQETRNGLNEIYVTTILSNLGFLAPRSKIVEVKQNNSKPIKMLFQEEKNKEFLEHNKRREGPIFSGDESLLYSKDNGFILEDISLARIVNLNWARKSENNFLTSLLSFNDLQYNYLNYTDVIRREENALARTSYITLNFFDEKIFSKKFIEFEILLVSMNAAHGLRPHNRRFYWNIFNKNFEPIYYDGDAYLFQPLGKHFIKYLDAYVLKSKIEKNTNIIKNLKLEIKNLLNEELITKFSLLADLNKKKAKEFFLQASEQVLVNLDQINIMLESFNENNSAKLINDLSNEEKEKRFIDRYLKEFKDIKFYKIYKHEKNDEKIKIKCVFGNFCSDKSIDSKNFNNILNNKFNNQRSILLPNKNNFVNDYTETSFDKIKVIHSKKSEVSFDDDILTLTQKFSDDWFLIKDQNLSNLLIKFIGKDVTSISMTKKQSMIKKPIENMLTGCLTIINSNLNDINIEATGGECEDTINLVSSKGNINSIKVQNANSDAIDFDFSDFKIKNILVNSAKNDCLDLSEGKYYVQYISSKNCIDKGLSVGEGSKVVVEDLNVERSDIAIASKDSSITEIKKANFDKVNICLSAYNKKQEFNGAMLKVINFKCTNFNLKTKKDNFSKIITDEF